MLAAHRDQENLVVSQQVPTKQQHNTRFPKTPSRFPQHDENAPTAFTGKTGLGGVKTLNKGNGTRQAMVTPMGTQNRAPLGNKTTNAKAKNGQLGGVKNIIQGIEQTQLKPTAQKPKQRPVDLAPLEIRLKEEQKPIEPQEEEPEYAPPKPKDLPYESDCFPKDMLTLEGLKKENILKGYYQHFYNPVDDDGVSRQDREFAETMKKVAAKAEERNKQERAALTFNIDDLSDTEMQIKAPAPTATIADSGRKVKGIRTKQPSSLASRRAASALSIHSDASSNSKASSVARTTKIRKPLTSLYQSKKPVARSATGVAASRTTIGYNRGRSASSMVNAQRRGTTAPVGTQRAVKPVETVNSLQSDLTITPTRLRQAVKQQEETKPRPQFMSIFDEDGDDDDLPPLSQPLDISDDEEEEFELKLNF
ncbi:hypothetical protein FOPG_06481 [Fusarium oxysporum f. sp. conglutinans race 2 54008]|uniref:Uncharacterized protein n=3 Tax=Fusarium oxysporum f. sp. conglutinans TaxID=100902 RepID=A0A8H6LPQ8_FUSOX|nr:hypothetical protein FOPG_06481 [Fusarium oxysporum f. sp. conglutinans race 2 54008]KAF6526336.1 hypothetical protein HZS61_009380 [Fusarium oxysporum f. sp. conglutinans]KAG6982156.1 hypothetical protein FocnCong_v009060 [Fusarium oxysporum f. sp. conglutinans]KAI8414594.1 hypothetical protein FOFC_04206 [Fusarium oxysporum]